MARDGDTRREKYERKDGVLVGRDNEKTKRHAGDNDSDDNTKSSIDSEDEHHRKKRSSSKKKRSSSTRRRYSGDDDDDDDESDSESDSGSGSESESEYSDSSYEERRRRRRERKKREERERRRKMKRRREKERKKRKRGDGDDDGDGDGGGKRKRKKKEKREKDKKKNMKKEKRKIGAVTDSWGKYGIVREVDMWNKRPEFTAWLAEVKKVSLESLSNWEEKKMFKEYMEDFNTATFPSKKYYDLDAYHRHEMEKKMKQGLRKVVETERTVFNDEEQRRQELMQAREKQKEQEVEALKNAMKSGMAQDMKEQARLKEEMSYLFKIGNNEAAAAIQRKLDPDVPM